MLEHRREAATTAAVSAVVRQVGVGEEGLRGRLAQADVDDGSREGVTTNELEEIYRLKGEERRLRGCGVLKAATSIFGWGNLTNPRNR